MFFSVLNKLLRLVMLLVIAGSMITISAMAFHTAVHQPFALDETEESMMGWNFATVGPKTFLTGEQGLNMSISHALLYTFSHALVQKFFGYTEFPVRMYGVFHFCLSLFLLLLIVRELIEGSAQLKRWVMAFAAALFVVNPLLIQHSVVINADNNLLTTAILLFVYFFIKFEKLPNGQSIPHRLLLGALLAFCIWAKEITPIFVALGILVYRLANREFKKCAQDIFFIGVCGAALFWLTWGLYCVLTGTDVLGFIKFTMIGKSRNAFSQRYLVGIPQVWLAGCRWPVYWMSAPFFIGLLIFLGKRIKNYPATRKLSRVDSLFVMGMAIWIPYQFFKPNIDMMKYQYPAYPILIAVLAWLFAEMIRRRAAENSRALLCAKNIFFFIVVVGILTVHYYRLGDYLLVLATPLSRYMNSLFFFYYYVPLFATLLVVALFSKKKTIWNNCVVYMLFCALPINAGLDLNHAKANYATFEIYRNYGEKGMRESIDYLAKNVQPNSSLVIRNDLLYHLTFRHKIPIQFSIEPPVLLGASDMQKLAFALANAPFDYIVIDPFSALLDVNRNALVVIAQRYTIKEKFGDFYILKRN